MIWVVLGCLIDAGVIAPTINNYPQEKVTFTVSSWYSSDKTTSNTYYVIHALDVHVGLLQMTSIGYSIGLIEDESTNKQNKTNQER